MPSLSKASYKISVDQGLLRNMHFLGELESVAPGKELARLTATDIEKWVKTLVVREDSSFDPAIVERALKGLKVQMKIANPKERMLEYCNDLFNRLDSVGYSAFKDDNPKMTVKLIQKHLHPKHFKATMQTMLEYQESLESDLGEYVRVLCEEAVKYEKYMRLGKTENEGSIPTKGSRSDSKPEKKAPLCLNPICAKEGKRHYVTGKTPKCDRTGPKEAKKLMKAYREKRKVKEGDARKVSQRESDSAQNSTLMNAMFGKKVERVLCADGGSDINLMPLDLFAELQKKEAVMDVEEYKVPRKYNMALTSDKEGEEIYFECDKEAVLNVELYIRHGCYLELRNIKWYIATGHVPDPLLGRTVLEALGINTKELLEAATGKIGNSVDIAELMGHQDYPEGSVARIIQDGVFHSDRGMPNEKFNGEDESWLELGKDKPGDIDRAINKAVQDTVDNGISESGQKRLRELLHEYRDILRLRLGNDRHADVEPMKIELKDNVRPVRAKHRRYTTEGRIFMERYVERAIEYGFGKINTTAKWVAAPVLVKKPAPAFFRLTFDYRAINAATLSVSWPMPHLDSELADLAGSKHFATVDFVSGYWQLPLEESSQELLCFMTSNKVVQPTRCTQGAKNAAANFQSKIEPLFSTIRDQLKAWLDDFMLHNKTENGLLEGLRTFFKICRQRHLKIGIAKSHLYLKQVHWCGRLIDGGGIQFDLRNISGLQKIHLPVTAGELCEYVHCLQWMSTSIPDFQNRIEPMRKVLEEANKKSGSRTKRSVQNITLESLGWGKEHKALFHEFQEQLRNIVKLKLGPQDWPTVIGMIMTALNEAPLKRLGSREDGTFRTPLEVMTGIKPARAMLHSTAIGKSNAKVRNLEKIRAMQILDIAGLQKQFDGLHKDVAERVTENRAKNIKSHNKKTNLVVPKFEKGDFVLVRRAQDKCHKQSYRWVGPRRITKVVSELIYEVEHMLTQKVEKVHAARLQLYRAGMDGAKVSKELLSHTECSEAKYEIVDEVLDVAGNEKEGIFVQVKWLGLPDRKDWTWHPIKAIHEDIPDKVEEFLRTTKKKRAVKQAREQIGLSL